jgi:hypothetical protein
MEMVSPPDLLWLKELYSKTWNLSDLRPTLFRTVEVTRAHYDKLQDSLNRKYPNRGSVKYDGRRHNVLSDKFDILRLAIPAEALPPRLLDNNEDRVDDDDFEINSCFPFTLRYLDLSTLKLKNKSDRFPSPLFLRQEYDHISGLLDDGPQDSTGSTIVSGQPGTGEVLVSLSRNI